MSVSAFRRLQFPYHGEELVNVVVGLGAVVEHDGEKGKAAAVVADAELQGDFNVPAADGRGTFAVDVDGTFATLECLPIGMSAIAEGGKTFLNGGALVAVEGAVLQAVDDVQHRVFAHGVFTGRGNSERGIDKFCYIHGLIVLLMILNELEKIFLKPIATGP